MDAAAALDRPIEVRRGGCWVRSMMPCLLTPACAQPAAASAPGCVCAWGWRRGLASSVYCCARLLLFQNLQGFLAKNSELKDQTSTSTRAEPPLHFCRSHALAAISAAPCAREAWVCIKPESCAFFYIYNKAACLTPAFVCLCLPINASIDRSIDRAFSRGVFWWIIWTMNPNRRAA